MEKKHGRDIWSLLDPSRFQVVYTQATVCIRFHGAYLHIHIYSIYHSFISVWLSAPAVKLISIFNNTLQTCSMMLSFTVLYTDIGAHIGGADTYCTVRNNSIDRLKN